MHYIARGDHRNGEKYNLQIRMYINVFFGAVLVLKWHARNYLFIPRNKIKACQNETVLKIYM